MEKQNRIGEFWLAWRTDREEWAICWNDPAAKCRRRKSTGVRDHNDGDPPVEAQQALAEHFARHGEPEKIDPQSNHSVSRIMTAWLAKEGINRARSAQYSYSVRHIQRWIDKRGTLLVSEISPTKMKGFIEMRQSEGVTGETIHADMAALARALKWAVEEEVIPYAPNIGKVDKKLRSRPKEVEYTQEQVAALLEASIARFDRRHVHLFTMIMLSCHARVEAVMELDAAQIRKGRIFFNAADRHQTTKRRPVVPIAPTLAPWLPDSGKVIMYRAQRKDESIYERPTFSIKTSFNNCLIDAGIVDKEGRPWGSPNTLRHTIHTYLQTVGVPQAQIDAAAGHVSDGGGTGRNYTHLRPEYLKDFITAVEAYWGDMDQLTHVHRSQVGPKIYDLKTGKAVQ
jgi:site-specific recombinase XerD